MSGRPLVMGMRYHWAPLVVLAAGAGALADDHRFAFVEEVRTDRAGELGYEQWFTAMWQTREDPGFFDLQIKHELEFAITDRLQVGVDVAEWHVSNGPGDEKDGPRFDNAAVELKHNFSDPKDDPLGVSIKGEVGFGPELVSLEGRLLLEKEFGDHWVVAYDLKFEAEWEGEDLDEEEGEISQGLGVGYRFLPQWQTGGEVLYEIPLPDWRTGEPQNIFAGPDLSFHSGEFRFCAAFLGKVTRSADDEPAFMTRFFFEVDF